MSELNWCGKHRGYRRWYPSRTSKSELNQNELDQISVAGDRTPYYYFINTGGMDIDRRFLIFFIVMHILMSHCYVIVFSDPSITHLYTVLYANLLMAITSPGVSVGAHRLWTHRSFKAHWPIRLFLAFGHILSGQFSIYDWARFHRTHHKFSDTDGDPHSTRRGMLFAHFGWIIRHRHPKTKEKMRSIDYSDLIADPIVRFQHRHFAPLYFLLSMGLPMSIPVLCWSESLYFSFIAAYVTRQMLSMHIASFVNSAAHLFGDKPYNHKIEPRNSQAVAFIAYGEGYHNFHHTYPFDYQLNELGQGWNPGRRLIELWARLGLAYDLRKATQTSVESAKERTRQRQEHPMANLY